MKRLQTAVHEIETAAELVKTINENENVMVCCGRMGPMCIPVYEAMEELEDERKHIVFRSMAFDSHESNAIKSAPLCKGFMGLPFTVYYKNGKMVKATTSIQNMQQITAILDEYFGNEPQSQSNA